MKLLNLLAATALLSAGTLYAAGTSLIANGDFETGGDAPDGWPKPSDTISYEKEGENHFLRLHSTEPGKNVLVYHAIPLTPEIKALELTYRVRYEDIKPGQQTWFDGRIMMNFKDAEKQIVKPSPPAPVFRGTNKEWPTKTQRFLVPEGATMFEFMPALFQAESGTLDFDDIRLTPIDPGLIKAEAAKWAAKVRAAVHRAPDAALIANGDFETLHEGAPVGWLKQTNENTSCEVEDGNHFLRLHTTEPGKPITLYRLIPLTPDDRAFELSYRVRYDGIKLGTQEWFDGRIMMNFKDVDKKVVPGAPAPYFRGTKKEWQTKTQRFLVPEDAVALEFMPAMFQAAAGTLDLDDIRLTSLSSADAEAMITANAAAAKKKAERDAIIQQELARPANTPELKVSGNKVVTADDKTVWLQGLSVDSMQWSPGENILWSIRVAIDEWHANVIRLAVHDTFWFGHGKGQKAGTEESYRQSVDAAVKLCAAKGAYLVLDLHQFGAPMAKHVEFWKDAATRYKNNPTVLFELFNEPHGISWEVWRNGGSLKNDQHTDVNPTENQEKNADDMSVGVQALVDAVRSTGAKNIVITGGLDWAYDLSGIMNGFALDDHGGHGIVYVSHIYPWKTDWQGKVLVAVEKYPIIVTEVGAIRAWEDFPFLAGSPHYPLEGWAEDMIGLIQKYKLHWTAFSFHPRCGPMIISDWGYTPTPYWGVYVKDALAGKAFELKKMR